MEKIFKAQSSAAIKWRELLDIQRKDVRFLTSLFLGSVIVLPKLRLPTSRIIPQLYKGNIPASCRMCCDKKFAVGQIC
jgi:hypothetical protein